VYDDKVKLERSPGMLRQPEVDYGLGVKLYVVENREKKAFSLEINENSKKENALDKIERNIGVILTGNLFIALRRCLERR
jgi:hypothetical protein